MTTTLIDESKKSNFYPDAFNWYELEENCRRCRLPLHIASGQEVAFCPNCAADKATAERGRRALANLKERWLAKKAAVTLAKARLDDDEDDISSWPEGMIL